MLLAGSRWYDGPTRATSPSFLIAIFSVCRIPHLVKPIGTSNWILLLFGFWIIDVGTWPILYYISCCLNTRDLVKLQRQDKILHPNGKISQLPSGQFHALWSRGGGGEQERAHVSFPCALVSSEPEFHLEEQSTFFFVLRPTYSSLSDKVCSFQCRCFMDIHCFIVFILSLFGILLPSVVTWTNIFWTLPIGPISPESWRG